MHCQIKERARCLHGIFQGSVFCLQALLEYTPTSGNVLYGTFQHGAHVQIFNTDARRQALEK